MGQIGPRKWLAIRQPGYGDLSPAERRAAADFSLVWGLFELRAMESMGREGTFNISCIRHLVDNGHVGIESVHNLRGRFQYFQARYYPDGQPSAHFPMLRFQPGPDADFVAHTLAAPLPSDADTLKASLIIVYRYRNNLFHGNKWLYDLHDQHDNFHHATALLMDTYDALVLP
ncbi:hypothetical protein HFO26_08070 [Rhizobium leguminosarum]|uniref:hypothetical protein n=1 Tax=Rhizobium leguminosarum TaxID=384 RepID=UPI001C93A11A|nr:hypothetical protein [Rhizobium leguminosarum]MBY5730245.1 hypothetical protein [Rhizobium leguminosarum]